jgi:hypothetical protein
MFPEPSINRNTGLEYFDPKLEWRCAVRQALARTLLTLEKFESCHSRTSASWRVNNLFVLTNRGRPRVQLPPDATPKAKFTRAMNRN